MNGIAVLANTVMARNRLVGAGTASTGTVLFYCGIIITCRHKHPIVCVV